MWYVELAMSLDIKALTKIATSSFLPTRFSCPSKCHYIVLILICKMFDGYLLKPKSAALVEENLVAFSTSS